MRPRYCAKPLTRLRLSAPSLFFFLCVLSLGPEPAQARFLHPDADEVDRDSNLDLEYYNDSLSYIASPSWRQTIDTSDIVFYASGGSLDANRFVYEEEYRGNFDENGLFSFTFERVKQQDASYAEERNLLRAIYFPLEHFLTPSSERGLFGTLGVGLVGDGDSFKKWGDLGGVLQLGRGSSYIRRTSWLVDFYYESKETIPGDIYLQQPGTIEWEGQITLPFHVTLKAHYEQDDRVVWQRPSRGYTYQQKQYRSQGALILGDLDKRWLSLGSTYWRKSEAKSYDQFNGFSKDLKKRVELYELIYQNYLQSDRSYFRLIASAVDRNADYTYTGLPAIVIPGQEPFLSPEVPEYVDPSIRYKAYNLVLDWDDPLSKDSHTRQRWGFNFTLAERTRTEAVLGFATRQTFEAKFNYALDFQLLEQVRCVVTTTWDLDWFYAAFPYDGVFDPWGGGQLQFLAHF